jgi:ABC-type antimicrobial peptide transport system permease subunit
VYPSSLFEPVRQILRELAPNVPVTETMTLREQRDISLWTDALATTMAGGLALLAFAVAGLGIFSLLAQMVATRTKEIGIRMAVGAHAARVVSLIVNQIVWVVAGGFLLGGASALMILPRANELFVGVSVQDPRVIALALLLVGAMAALASAVPAWRASCLQPTIALRED